MIVPELGFHCVRARIPNLVFGQIVRRRLARPLKLARTRDRRRSRYAKGISEGESICPAFEEGTSLLTRCALIRSSSLS